MNRKSKNSSKNSEKIENKANWFIVEIVEKLEPVKVNARDKKRLCTVYGNWHLIKASNAEKAFDKAVKLGEQQSFNFINSHKEEMRWEFVGIGDLLPIYEDIEDKSEIMYSDFGDITFQQAKKMIVNRKKHLANIKPMKTHKVIAKNK